MLIKILAGTFGLALANGGVKPITKYDGPVEVDNKTAQRLVNLGIAKAVNGEVEKPVVVKAKEDIKVAAMPEYSKQNTKAQLVEIAKVYGVDEDDLKAAETKAAIIALIDAVAEPEDAPELDAESALD